MAKESLNITQSEIEEFLANCDLFAKLPKSSIIEISQNVSLKYLAGNKCLIKQGSSANSMYVLMYGLLCVIKKDKHGKPSKAGEITTGRVVGEIACLFDEKRTASIYAVRDCVLLKLSKKDLFNLAQKHPEVRFAISRESVKRLVNPSQYTPKQSSACFSFIAAGGAKQIEAFTEKVCAKLTRYGKTILLTPEHFKQLYGKLPQSFDSADVRAFLHKLESEYRFIIYIAEEKSNWAKHCIRQADKIFLVGQYGARTVRNEVETLLPKKRLITNPSIELVLLFSKKRHTPDNVQNWLENRNVCSHHNLRLYKAADIARFTRMITGNALGLVLSGGGSLGLAHVGVIRALQEAKIPIDYVGGTSMGSLVGALLAMEYEHTEIANNLEKQLGRFQDNLDYTLPIISLIKAKKLDSLLKESFGRRTRIENLWQKYFCVSTNITTNELNIHDQGLLWDAIRASLSLPGILPVVLNEKKEVLVDGGILNNLPVDIMRNKINSGKILASSIKSHQDPPPKMSYDEYTSSGWGILFKHLLLPKLIKKNLDNKMRFINITSIIQNSMIIASNNHQEKMIDEADYNIIMDLNKFSMVDLQPIKEIIGAGYKQAKPIITNLNLKKNKLHV